MPRKPTAPPATKLCRRCGQTFPLSEFLRPNTKRVVAWPWAYCPSCRRAATRDTMRRLRQRRLAAGVCEFCGEARAFDALYCLRHWVRGITSSTLGRGGGKGAVVEAVLALLVAQDYRCALTGVPLVPGRNASLDHIVPKASGGSHEVANLQWVTTPVNWAKGVLSVGEFVALCRAVVAHQQ